jgi:uncharacterized protein with PQ loop repeat
VTGGLAGICGYGGMTIIAVNALPQVIRLARQKEVKGVSGVTWSFAVCSFGLWCAYGFLASILTQVPGNGISLFGAMWVVVSLVRRGWNIFAPAAILLLSSALAAALFAWLGVSAIGWAAVAVAAWMRLPQLRQAWRPGPEPALSVAAWILNGAGSFLWFLYGLLSGNAPITAASLWAVIVSLAIVLGRATASRRSLARAGPKEACRAHKSSPPECMTS